MSIMVVTVQIRCINKLDRYDPEERITHVGGVNPDGRRWKLAQEEAIQGIESGRYSFYVEAYGRRVSVTVRTSRFGNKYLTTEADGSGPNNLLSLPECP